MAYGIPLGGLLVGMLLGDQFIPLEHSLGAFIGAAIGLALPLLWLLVTEKKRRLDPKWTPQIKRIIPRSQAD